MLRLILTLIIMQKTSIICIYAPLSNYFQHASAGGRKRMAREPDIALVIAASGSLMNLS